MTSEHYFLEIEKSILEVSSSADLLVYNDLTKKQHDELFESVLILHIFHIANFGISNKYLSDFIEKDFKAEDLETKRKNKSKRKSDGAFFTPPYISQYIVKETIGTMVEKILEDKNIEDKVSEICNLKICDPAMGGGIFLVCAHDFLMRSLIEIDQDKYSVESMASMSIKAIFGVDINPVSVELSKLMLNLNVAKWKNLNKFDEYVQTVKKNFS
jgi:type I restriction-modification system DNA methylase subunit